MIEGDLSKLGFDDFFRKGGDDCLHDGFSYARVTEVNKNSYVVSDGSNEMTAELSGKFLFGADSAVDFPTVGDWVTVQAMDNNTHAIVHSVLPRKTLIRRKTSGNRIDFQLIVSNIDYGLVVMSAEHVNYNLLDRYLVMLNESGIEPVATVSKTDLKPAAEIDAIVDGLSKITGNVVAVSTRTEGGTDALANILVPGKTYCLLGQSGVGKSSLLNKLLGTSLLEVGEVREWDGRGRHTTVRRQLVRLDSGSLFIDTPGIRELGNFQVDKGLDKTFDEFSSFALQCRFSDCSHTHEKGCAVIAAVENGDISEDRYRNFLKLRKESEFYDMSYLDRRKKDKSFGKMVRHVKKVKGVE